MLIKTSTLFLINLFIFELILLWTTVADARRQLKIGGIFSNTGETDESEFAFRYAIQHENIYNAKLEIIPIIKKIDPQNTFEAEKTACDLASEGVVGIYGPSSTYTSDIVASICNELGIPHIITHWQTENNLHHKYHNFTRNFFPDSGIYSRAISQIIRDYDWTDYTVIYETNDGLIRLENTLQNHEPQDNPITVRQIHSEEDYLPLLKEIFRSGSSRIVLDCSPDKIISIFKHAATVKMLGEYQNYFITSLDAHTIDYAELQHVVKSNITTIRMMSATSFAVTSAVQEWRTGEFRRNGTYGINPETIKTESALVNDAIFIFVMALREYHATNTIHARSMKCTGSYKWEQGQEILDKFDEITSYPRNETGMTGKIHFNELGMRTEFYLEILELSKEGLKKIAFWDQEHGVNVTREFSEVSAQIIQSLQNKTVIVVSRLGMPFLQKRKLEEGEYPDGNNEYEGYSMDLIDSIAKVIGFQYRFQIVKKYGSQDPETKKWDGLVGELVDRKADLAICDLTITYARRKAVDFTMPFMHLGISILFAKPEKEPTNLFKFMDPLSIDVWLYMATAYLIVSIVLFILAKLAPDDWENPHPCDDDPEELETIWNLQNCSWLTVGSIMQQGCDLLPKAISTRLAAGLWWFFALIVISSYTANLAAFLTMERMDDSIESAEDLAKQNLIKYGAVKEGTTLAFFRESNSSLYKRMYSVMESSEPSVFTASNAEGEERVAKSKHTYAFFMESTTIEYITNKNCNLTQIGGLLDSKDYGIAMPMDSPYRKTISQTLLKLQEDGKLHRIKDKWWKERNVNVDGTCDADKGSAGDNLELGLANVGGVFVVLLVGCIAGIFIGILEFLWNVRAVAIEEKITPYQAFKEEFLFALNFRLTTKKVRGGKSEKDDDDDDADENDDGADTISQKTHISHKSHRSHRSSRSYGSRDSRRRNYPNNQNSNNDKMSLKILGKEQNI